MTETNNKAHLEAEIRDIEQSLAEKKANLERGDSSIESSPESEKKLIKETIGERLQSTPVSPIPQQSSTGSTPSYNLPELQEQVQSLINIAFNVSIDEAIKQVRATNNAALIDAFHDALVDELYQHLVERQKLTKL